MPIKYTIETATQKRMAENVRNREATHLCNELIEELHSARAKFPGKNVTFAALIEEVGELATALFEEPRASVRKEAVQVAVMAMRVILDGDHTFEDWRADHGLDALGAAETTPAGLTWARGVEVDGGGSIKGLGLFNEITISKEPTKHPHRITAEMVTEEIAETNYTAADFTDGRKVIICALELHNGFMVTGESACIDPAAFDEEVGRDLALGKARAKVFEFLAFRGRDKMRREELRKANDAKLAEKEAEEAQWHADALFRSTLGH